MKRSARVFGDTLLRSGRRLFATLYEDEVKRTRVALVAVVDTEEHRVEVLGHGDGGDAEGIENGRHNSVGESGIGTKGAMEIDDEKQREFEMGEFKKVNGNGTDEVMGIDDEEHKREIKLGESKKMGLVDLDHNHDDGDNVSRNKRFRDVYARKRKRTVPRDSSLKCSSFEEKCSSDKRYEKKYLRKKARTSLGSKSCDSKLDFVGKDVLCEGPVVFVGSCSYSSGDSTSMYRFSCFVSSVLWYMRMARVFSWRQFSSFLLSELTASVYSSAGIRVLQDSTCTMSHGFFKISGSILSVPFVTVDFRSLPFCFLYMHSSLLLKYACVSITDPIDENVTEDDVNVPSIVTIERDQPLGKLVVARRARSGRKTVPRVSLFKKCSRRNERAHVEKKCSQRNTRAHVDKKCFQRNARAHVENIVPVPGVHEVAGYAKEEYVPFRLPDLYISSRSDELTRALEKSYPIYDMDSQDEEWLKKFNTGRFGDNEPVLEDAFEKIIDAFERGIYCTPDDYSDAASTVDRCLRLASKEVLETVYSYWMHKRRKKRSALVTVFQYYRRKRVKRHPSNAVLRKKRSFKRRASRHGVGKELDFLKAMLNDQKMAEEVATAILKVHETQEAARRSEAAAVVKRQAAQAFMETADLVTYRATMALRIAEARAAAGSVDDAIDATLHFLLGE